MMADQGKMIVQQLIFQAPTLLVYLLGFVVALAFLGQHKLPALLTMLGTGLLIVVSIGQPLLQFVVPNEMRANLWGVIAFVASCLRAVGLLLIVSAVFTGREVPHPAQLAEKSPFR